MVQMRDQSLELLLPLFSLAPVVHCRRPSNIQELHIFMYDVVRLLVPLSIVAADLAAFDFKFTHLTKLEKLAKLKRALPALPSKSLEAFYERVCPIRLIMPELLSDLTGKEAARVALGAHRDVIGVQGHADHGLSLKEHSVLSRSRLGRLD